jgi:FMN phosphatase YigB (HAD superfamily)
MHDSAYAFEQSNDKIDTSKLPNLLDRYHASINVLSLDCFDTLLWRQTAAPVDVFYTLQNQADFLAAGLKASMRVSAEARARQHKLFNSQGSEVTLADIYAAHRPGLTPDVLDALARAELAAEMATCYAFPPMVKLIQQALHRGMKVIIVSDTYFSEAQLRELLAKALPADVMASIDHVFCSSAYQKSKMNGLFTDVIRTVKQPAETFLHLGDNLTADYIAPRSLKMQALHFVREAECMTDLYRLQTIAASIVDPSLRSTRAIASPFRGVFAAAQFAGNKPETFIGYASLGPLMYTFAQFIREEVEEIRSLGKKPKILFLMRDAYLPSLACEMLVGEPIGHRVRISRFAAFAASFQTVGDIDRYLVNVIQSQRFTDITRQLLLPDKVAEPIIKTALKSPDPTAEFVRLLHRKDILKIIFTKSTDYRQRFIRYLEKDIELTQGDTLVFVDLGYSGTAQQQLAPIFQRMGVEVVGRYLIALSTPNPLVERRGLIEASWCDEKVMHMLVGHIAILEQLCTANEKSVVNYDQAGNILCSDVSMQAEQQSCLTRIQSECLRFISDAKKFFAALSHHTDWRDLREVVMVEIARMIFLPTTAEMQCLEAFQFDVNMGTNDIHRLFDLNQGLTGLRQRGLFYMEKNSKTKRTNYPAELRAAGFELAMTSMIQNRLGLEIKPQDMLCRQEIIEARLHYGQEMDTVPLEAMATHDGYFSVWAPAGTAVSLFIGKKYHWIQLESATLIETEAFIQQKESGGQRDAMPYLHFEGMLLHSGGLLECGSDAGVIVMKMDASLPPLNYIFRLVFRPLVVQEKKWKPQHNGMRIAFNITT